MLGSIGKFMMVNWRKPVIYALLYLSRSRIPQNLKEIRKVEKLSAEEIKKYQEAKLKKLLLYAYNNVPYYHKVLSEAKVVENGKVNLNNFNKIPILTKEIIRKEGKNLYSKEKRKGVYENTSGGSTGEPVRFLQDKYYDDWNIATKLYFFNEFFNKEMGEPEINLWGSDRDVEKNSLSKKERIINFLYNRKFLNAFKVDGAKLNSFVKEINDFRPNSMWVYVESMDILSKHIEESKSKIHKPSFIISTAGTLYPEIRENAEKTFNCPVYNQYGSREVGGIAIECTNKNGLHEFPWSNKIELVKEKIVITGLNNFSMPLIRYEIGDIGVEKKSNHCLCGRETLKLEEIKGRTINHFKTKKGKIVHGQYFIHLFYFRDWIEKFQIIQKDYSNLVIKIIKKENENNEDIREIEDKIKSILDKSIKIKWEFVKEIPSTKSGKYLYTISEVK